VSLCGYVGGGAWVFGCGCATVVVCCGVLRCVVWCCGVFGGGVQLGRMRAASLPARIDIYVYMHTCMSVYVYWCVCIHIHVHVDRYIHIHVYIYICIRI